jgi:hypothetical protein
MNGVNRSINDEAASQPDKTGKEIPRVYGTKKFITFFIKFDTRPDPQLLKFCPLLPFYSHPLGPYSSNPDFAARLMNTIIVAGFIQLGYSSINTTSSLTFLAACKCLKCLKPC